MITTPNTILVSDRLVGHPRIFRQDADFHRRAIAGFRGEIIPGYDYEVALNTSQRRGGVQKLQPDQRPRTQRGHRRWLRRGRADPVAGGALLEGGRPPATGAGLLFPEPFAPASLAGVFGTDIRSFETKYDGRGRQGSRRFLSICPPVPSVSWRAASGGMNPSRPTSAPRPSWVR